MILTDVNVLIGAFRGDHPICNWLLEQPNAIVVEPGRRHWQIFERLCRETDTTGSRVTDAWFAALAIEHGCEWVTLDRDFARFPGLKWSMPASP